MSKADDRAKFKHQRSPKRPKVDNDKDPPSGKPPTPEHHMRFKDYISHADCMRKQLAEREADKITSSSAASPRKATLNELRVKRATILDNRADTQLGLMDKVVGQ